MNRRTFLKASGLALFSTGIAPDVFVRMAHAGTTKGKKILVAIFQRGAVDGLNVIVPYGDAAYAAARPNIAIGRPGSQGGAIDIDGHFGLHPAMASLVPLLRNQSLAAVHAVGSPDNSRSHFDAQDFMETGTPGVKSTQDGFLTRALIAEGTARRSPLRAVSLTAALPRILGGDSGAIAMNDLSRFGVRGNDLAEASFESMYAGAVAGALQKPAEDSFEAAKIIRSTNPAKVSPANGAQYPRGPLGDSLRQIAQLIRADVGLELAFTDVSGWDTHANEGGATGQLANSLRTFADAIAAFTQDLGSKMGDVVLVTMSEFGRTVRQNGNRGTDHGHGTVMLVAGGGVKGGKVYGRWPGLSADQLYEGRDLAVTTDFRDVFAELLTKQLAVPSLANVFPGYAPRMLGVLG